jgi:hypothetical protein
VISFLLWPALFAYGYLNHKKTCEHLHVLYSFSLGAHVAGLAVRGETTVPAEAAANGNIEAEEAVELECCRTDEAEAAAAR